MAPNININRRVLFRQEASTGYQFTDSAANAYYNALVTANGGVDIDAQSLYGISLDALKTAIDEHFVALDSAGVLSKLTHYFPFIGGTATTHAICAIDATSELTYTGSPTHDATGMSLNGSTQYASMSNSPIADAVYTDNHLMFYPNVVNASSDWGTGGRDTSNTALALFYANSATLKDCENTNATLGAGRLRLTSSANLDTVHINSRTAVDRQDLYVNGSSVANTTGSLISTDLPTTSSTLIGAWDNSGSPARYLDGYCCSSSIGFSLDSTEASDFTNEINTLNTTLGR